MANPMKWTDEQVESEITRLNASEYVRLARKERQLIYKRRNYMNQLQWLEARGRTLSAQGITFENIKEKMFSELPEDTEESE